MNTVTPSPTQPITSATLSKRDAIKASNCKAFLQTMQLLNTINEVAPEPFKSAIAHLKQGGMRDTHYAKNPKVPQLLPANEGQFGRARSFFTLFFNMMPSLAAPPVIAAEHGLEKPAIIVSGGHYSDLDAPTCSSAMDTQMVGLAKADLTKGRFYLLGLFLKEFGTVFIDRKDKDSHQTALTELQQKLLQGKNVGIFPEGTRKPVPGGDRGAFKIGFLSVNGSDSFTQL